jgi:hypothetical protein
MVITLYLGSGWWLLCTTLSKILTVCSKKLIQKLFKLLYWHKLWLSESNFVISLTNRYIHAMSSSNWLHYLLQLVPYVSTNVTTDLEVPNNNSSGMQVTLFSCFSLADYCIRLWRVFLSSLNVKHLHNLTFKGDNNYKAFEYEYKISFFGHMPHILLLYNHLSSLILWIYGHYIPLRQVEC